MKNVYCSKKLMNIQKIVIKLRSYDVAMWVSDWVGSCVNIVLHSMWKAVKWIKFYWIGMVHYDSMSIPWRVCNLSIVMKVTVKPKRNAFCLYFTIGIALWHFIAQKLMEWLLFKNLQQWDLMIASMLCSLWAFRLRRAQKHIPVNVQFKMAAILIMQS